jgi:hypothetical protein
MLSVYAKGLGEEEQQQQEAWCTTCLSQVELQWCIAALRETMFQCSTIEHVQAMLQMELGPEDVLNVVSSNAIRKWLLKCMTYFSVVYTFPTAAVPPARS